MTQSGEDVVYTLVVRVGREHDGESEATWEWRGEVRNAMTSELRYFRELDGLLLAIQELLRVVPGENDAAEA
jgi:hypothetical protein